MNTTVDAGVLLAEQVRASTEDSDDVEVAVLPPFTHLWSVHDALRNSHVEIGAQDVFWEKAGAFTGEISPLMLAGWCRHALVGHSERRHIIGETDAQVGRKFSAAADQALHVIVAVGEIESERNAGTTHAVVDRQLDAAFAHFTNEPSAATFVIAYEPVWAIGTGRTATPDQAQEVCAHIKDHLSPLAPRDVVRVLYGGSVTAENAAALFAEADIDGALVGGASLRAPEFAEIVTAAAESLRARR
ncbi:MAG: triose-phosphate isomerase [Candidatus Dormibacteraeota bacterium]|nr:triose-phosphate isomerase [Candidatus Dormibacteraeota bacterium]